MKALTFLTAILFTSLALTAHAEDARPNPLANAKVGDWVEYSMKASAKATTSR